MYYVKIRIVNIVKIIILNALLVMKDLDLSLKMVSIQENVKSALIKTVKNVFQILQSVKFVSSDIHIIE